jgi:hypothetical protein
VRACLEPPVLALLPIGKASELRKNEPHPMGFLAAVSQLLDDLLVDLILSVQEANEVSIGHWCCISRESGDARLGGRTDDWVEKRRLIIFRLVHARRYRPHPLCRTFGPEPRAAGWDET